MRTGHELLIDSDKVKELWKLIGGRCGNYFDVAHVRNNLRHCQELVDKPPQGRWRQRFEISAFEAFKTKFDEVFPLHHQIKG